MSSLTTCSGQGVVVQRKKSVCSRISGINPHTSQMDGVKSWLVALEKVALSFSHFIIEHWVPAQAILIDL